MVAFTLANVFAELTLHVPLEQHTKIKLFYELRIKNSNTLLIIFYFLMNSLTDFVNDSPKIM